MPAKSLQFSLGIRSRPLLAAGALALIAADCFAQPEAAAGTEDEAFEAVIETGDDLVFLEDLDGRIRGVAGDTITTGSQDAMSARTNLPNHAFGGVDPFQIGGYLGDDWEIQTDIRAIPGLEDYYANFRLSHLAGVYLDFVFDRTRVFYNGVGGYLPVDESFYQLPNSLLHVDWQVIAVELGSDGFEWGDVFARYTNQRRDGSKTSTVWGNVFVSDLGDIRGVQPSLLELDEQRQILELGATVDVQENTSLAGRIFLEKTNLDDTTKIDNAAARIPNRITYTETQDTESITGYLSLRHEFNGQVALTTAGSYSKLKSDVGGSRIYGNDFDEPYDPAFRLYGGSTDVGFIDLTGGADWEQIAYQLNVLYTPLENLTIVPSFRAESVQQDARTAYLGVRNFERQYDGWSEDDFNRAEGKIELRYRASSRLNLYGRGIWAKENGNLSELLLSDEITPRPRKSIALDYASAYRRTTWLLLAGFDYQMDEAPLTFRIQGYYKEQDNEYDPQRIIKNDPRRVITRGLYPGYINRHLRETWDFNAGVTWRPLPNLTSITRFDYQWMPLYTTAFTFNTGNIPTGQIKSWSRTQIASQSFTWSPRAWLTMLMYGNYIRNRLGSQTELLPNEEVLDAKNDYWSAGIQAVIDINEVSRLELGYQYLNAGNFFDNSSSSVPYGVSLEDHVVSALYSLRLRDGVLWNIGAGFFGSQEDSSGGNNDFTSYLLSTSVEYVF